MKEMIAKINKSKSCFFEKINKIDKPLARLIKKKRGNQKILRNKWQWRHDDPKPMGCNKSSVKRKVCGNTSLPQETWKISNNLILHLKELEKNKWSPKKQIIKIRAQLNEIETKKIPEKINETKSLLFENIKNREGSDKIRNEREITTETTEIQKIIREYYEQLYNNKLDNLKNKSFESYNQDWIMKK